MTISAWKKVDRFRMLTALLGLVDELHPVPLMIVGPDDADRATAADVAEDLFAELGWQVVRVRQATTKPTTTHQVLARAWRAIDDLAGALEIPRSSSQARHLNESEVVAAIVEACAQRGSARVVFIFDTVDPLDPIPRPRLRYFGDLARDSNCPVVIFSRSESDTPVPPTCASVVIGDMPVAEIRMSLKTAPEFGHVADAVIDGLLDQLEAISEEQLVPAFDAYDLIQSGLRKAASRGN